MVLIPDRAVGEDDLVNADPAAVAQNDLISRPSEGENDLITLLNDAGDGDFLRQIAVDLQPVRAAPIGDDILPVAPAENVDVVAISTLDIVIAGASLDHVVQLAGGNKVVSAGDLARHQCGGEFFAAPLDAVGKDHRRRRRAAYRRQQGQLIAG